MMLPTDPKARKDTPIARGVLDYFPDAMAAVAHVSKVGNDQHNPGQPMHWARGKSTDHADCIVRHLIERGTFDTDGLRHSAKVAWRALALLQTEIEEEREARATEVAGARQLIADTCAPRTPEHWSVSEQQRAAERRDDVPFPISVPRAQVKPPTLYQGGPEDFLDGKGNRR